MVKKKLKIHSENILPIIKKWLYSDHEIFARELTSNASDAIRKLEFLGEQGEAKIGKEPLCIRVKLDKEKKTLSFSDTGIGMDAKEIETYIAQIAFSGAEDFVERYQGKGEKEQIIGHFGLGFYSSYMVADKVEIHSLSFKEGAKAAHWSCEGSSDYTLGSSDRKERGTEVILHISKDSEEFLEESRVRHLLEKYCSFFPCPLYFGEDQINKSEPLWLKNPSDCTEKDYLDFYKVLYPFDDAPLFWVHLSVDYPFHLKGILYFPPLRKENDSRQSSIQLFCRRVFVSEDCKDLVPRYLSMLKGAIESPDIPLNVSRSSLQRDKTVRMLAQHVSKKVADRLLQLYRKDREKFIASWKDLAPIIKLGVLEDEKFYEKVKELLLWPNTEGSLCNLEEYTEKNQLLKDRIIYCSGEEDSALLALYRKKGVEVLRADSYIDSHLMQFLERKLSPVLFQRIDGALEDLLLDQTKEDTLLDADGKTKAGRLADCIRKYLSVEELEVEAKAFDSDELPAIVIFKEENRRMRDFMRSMKQDLPINGKHQFVVNSQHPLFMCLEDLSKKDSSLAEKLVKHSYDSALLAQRELKAEALDAFLARDQEILSHFLRGI